MQTFRPTAGRWLYVSVSTLLLTSLSCTMQVAGPTQIVRFEEPSGATVVFDHLSSSFAIPFEKNLIPPTTYRVRINFTEHVLRRMGFTENEIRKASERAHLSIIGVLRCPAASTALPARFILDEDLVRGALLEDQVITWRYWDHEKVLILEFMGSCIGVQGFR